MIARYIYYLDINNLIKYQSTREGIELEYSNKKNRIVVKMLKSIMRVYALSFYKNENYLLQIEIIAFKKGGDKVKILEQYYILLP